MAKTGDLPQGTGLMALGKWKIVRSPGDMPLQGVGSQRSSQSSRSLEAETRGPEGLYQVDLALWKETWHRSQCVMESFGIGRTEGCCSQEQKSKLMIQRPPFLL